MLLRAATAITVLSIVAGCQMSTTNYAYKEGATVAQKDKDSFDCDLAATQRVPTNTQVATTPTYRTPTYYTPATTNCYGYTCTTTGGTAYGGQVYGGQTYSYDANTSLRKEYFQKCMASKGYKIASVPNCPSGAVSADVRQSLSGKLRAPVEGSCVVGLTERSGNIVYPNERAD